MYTKDPAIIKSRVRSRQPSSDAGTRSGRFHEKFGLRAIQNPRMMVAFRSSTSYRRGQNFNHV